MKVAPRGWRSIRIKGVILDSGPLGRLAYKHPPADLATWLKELASTKIPVYIAEVTDYEVRRNLLLHHLTRSLAELDRLRISLVFAPITTPIMLRAAEFWAKARQAGRPTA